jgi:hypothetical protein
MATIYIFYIVELGGGGANMKKKRIEYHTFENSEASERRYHQKLKADQRMLQTFLIFFSRCFCVPFYPYDYTVFLQNDLFVDQPEDNENKESLKNKKINNCAKEYGNHTHSA